ncbi:MAG: bifunctional oligoribonuclease/PAP phosphatase NrnA [bacterium]
MMIEFDKLQKVIEDNNSFLLTTHVNPDADAIGSVMAFYYILKKLGKSAYIINHSHTPDYLGFMDKQGIVEKFNPGKHASLISEVDIIVLLDISQTYRTVGMADYIRNSGKTIIAIDHHQDAEQTLDYLFVGTDYCATGEIIYDFIQSTKIVEMDYEIAFQLYTAIMTDTGSFRFERTTPTTHRIAAHLLEFGIDPKTVYEEHYEKGSIEKIRLLGRALDSIKLNETKEVSYMVIRQKDLIETGCREEDVEGYVNYTLQIEGVKAGILFLELRNGFKVSFRTRGMIPANKIASEFGGGGHINAAGTRLYDKKMEEFFEVMISRSQKYIDEYLGK